MNLRAQIENMSPREQRLLVILGSVFGALLFLGIPIYIYSELSAARDHNEEVRGLLERMNKASELLAVRRKEREAVELRFAKPAPPLASFIESAARQNGLDVPESTDRPDVSHKGYTEHITVVKMRKVGLKPLVEMLEKIERSGHPVAITQLSIKARASDPDSYDVQLGVSSYDKDKPAPSEDKAPKGKAKSGDEGDEAEEDEEGGEEL
jgi:general secretion pathway protein M